MLTLSFEGEDPTPRGISFRRSHNERGKVLASMTKPGLKATSDKPTADYDAKRGGHLENNAVSDVMSFSPSLSGASHNPFVSMSILPSGKEDPRLGRDLKI
jgi:hypothetical protein